VVRRVVDMARAVGVDHRAIPGVYEILSGKVLISQFRDVDVEDLLRREPVEADEAGIAAYVSGKRVLVTGAGGSIGSEIVRQIATFTPAEIILLGRGENSLYEFEREFDRTHPDISHHTVVADIRQLDRLAYLFNKYRPEVVFHAAAHKHVPLMEANPDEAIFNNVLGTRHVAKLALDYGVERFVNISTDKAVNPTSIMGATKRIAEKIVTNIASQAGEDRIFVSVRFGNVLGSRGSVIPVFKKQIERGGPLTVTHPHVQRYFMTIPEASQLVLEAGRLGSNGCVYVLDMGEPIKIVDLARDLIRLSGLEPGRDIQIEYIGLRPGEKLYEELLTAEEGIESARHEKIYVARVSNHLDLDGFDQTLEQLFTAATAHNEDEMRRLIKLLVSTYNPLRGGPAAVPHPPSDSATSGNGQRG
jgi:FlaA1/EpsC-like NDP-sugar epimerase